MSLQDVWLNTQRDFLKQSLYWSLPGFCYKQMKNKEMKPSIGSLGVLKYSIKGMENKIISFNILETFPKFLPSLNSEREPEWDNKENPPWRPSIRRTRVSSTRHSRLISSHVTASATLNAHKWKLQSLPRDGIVVRYPRKETGKRP